MLLLLLFLVSSLAAEDSFSPIAHFEAGVPSLAGGCINVITGAPVISDVDLALSGIEPYAFTRHLHYEPDVSNKVVRSWDYDMIELLRAEDSYREQNGRYEVPNPTNEASLSLERDSQNLLYFNYKWGEKGTKAVFDALKYAKGATNFANGRPSGQTNLKNIHMERARRGYQYPAKEAEIIFGSGEKRSYVGETSQCLQLRWVRSPTGFKQHHYYSDLGHVVELITPTGVKVGTLSEKYERRAEGHADRVRSDDGREALLLYTFDEQLRKTASRDLLTRVERSDKPSVSYTYHASEKNRQLEGIFYPNGRGISFTYWREGDLWRTKERKTTLSKEAFQNYRIREIFEPVGPTAERIKTHLFQYFRDKKDYDWAKGQTRVVLSYGNFDDYFFDRSGLLEEIRHYSNPHKTKEVAFILDETLYPCDLREQFFWNQGGEIKTLVHADGQGLPLRVKHFIYDARGNITEETLYGNLSGTCNISPAIDGAGNPLSNGCESLTKRFTFSDDGFNLTTSEKHPNGLEIYYTYVSGTNLLSQKMTYGNGELLLEELYTYDADACLIQKEEKSGSLHRLEKIVPLKEAPFGYPKERFILAKSNDREVLLESFSYLYNKRGDLLREERRDCNGNLISSLERTVDGHGNCLVETNHLGYQIVRTYDENDNCIVEIGPRAEIKKLFSFDYMNRKVEEKLVGKDRTWTIDTVYNHLSQKELIRDFYDQEIETHFDRYGRPLEVKLPHIITTEGMRRPILSKVFDPFGNPIETTDPRGFKIFKKFTALDQCSEIIHPDGGVERFFYSLEGLLLRSIDLEGVETKCTYDPLGRLLTKESPFGVEQNVYEGLLLVKKVDLAGLETYYRYDPFGRLSETISADRREKLHYDPLGHPFRKEHYEGELLLSTEVSHVDTLGRLLESYTEDPSGQFFNHKKFTYDEANNCIEEWTGESHLLRTFDELNRLTSVVDHQGNKHRIFYETILNEAYQQLLRKTVVDPNGQQIVTTYDTLGRESSLRYLNPFGFEIKKKTITYNVSGQVIKEEMSSKEGQRLLQKEVDSCGRVLTLIEPLKKVTHMSYTKGGKLRELTKPDGVKLTHLYEEGRLKSLFSSDGKLAYLYTYAPRGELIEVFDEVTGISSFQHFSLLGDLEKEVLPTGQIIHYGVDGLGRTTSYSLPDGGEVRTTYNAVAATSVTRLDPLGTPLYRQEYLAFDAVGNATEEKLIDGSSLNSGFDTLYQLTSLVHALNREENFIYDAVGNLKSFDQNGETLTYNYDDLYQLTTEKNHNYSYDPFHNRLSKDDFSYTVNELDQLISQSDATYRYDPNGNLIRLETSSDLFLFAYDPLNRLLEISKNGETVTYTYDSFNRRLTRNEVPFYFYREQEIGTPIELRTLGPGLGGDIGATIAIEIEGQTFTPLHDHQGNIIALTDLEGKLLSSWNFTAYGELIGECPSPWGFASKRVEPLTSWISFPRRDYDPTTGRWTTADPLGHAGGPNLYAYVTNRPLIHRDPLGLSPDEVWTAADDPYENIKGFFWERGGSLLESTLYNTANTIDKVYSFFEDEEKKYPDKSCLYADLCNFANLPENSLVLVLSNGICNSLEDFKETCLTFKEWGFNVAGMYNPSHGSGLINHIRDGIRAFGGARGDVGKHRQAVEDFTNFWNQLLSVCPRNTSFLAISHSEGNIIQTRAISRLDSVDRMRIGYLGVGSPAYLSNGICNEQVYLETISDIITRACHEARKRADPKTIHVVESAPEASWIDHSFASYTSYVLNGIRSYESEGKIKIK